MTVTQAWLFPVVMAWQIFITMQRLRKRYPLCFLGWIKVKAPSTCISLQELAQPMRQLMVGKIWTSSILRHRLRNRKVTVNWPVRSRSMQTATKFYSRRVTCSTKHQPPLGSLLRTSSIWLAQIMPISLTRTPVGLTSLVGERVIVLPKKAQSTKITPRLPIGVQMLSATAATKPTYGVRWPYKSGVTS